MEHKEGEEKRAVLEALIAEMEALKLAEENGEASTGHFRGKNLDFRGLLPEDEQILEKIKNKTILREEFEAWRNGIEELSALGAPTQLAARKAFASFAANKATPVFGMQDLEAAAKRRKEQ